MRAILTIAGLLGCAAVAGPVQAQSARCVNFAIAGPTGRVCSDGKKFPIGAGGTKVADGEWQFTPESRGLWHVEGKLPGVPKLAFEVGSSGAYEDKLVVIACVTDATALGAAGKKIDYAKGACDADWRPLADFPFKDPS